MIIKNCPCYDKDYEECLNTYRDDYVKCENIFDCLPKRIVERLKLYYIPTGIDTENTDEFLCKCTRHNLVAEILDMLEIEECE